MKIDILTLFPEMFVGPFDESIISRAHEKGIIDIKIHNLRDWATDNHKTVDDRPFSGGAGMVLKVDIIDKALTDLRKDNSKVILLDAGGKIFNQKKAVQLTHEKHLIFICGHYEGVDHRVHEHLVDEVVSIGEFVLTGGELPAMTITDAVVRLLPDVIDPESLKEESHSKEGYVEYPQYTRPAEYKGWKVPDVLRSGDHGKIEEWKKENIK